MCRMHIYFTIGSRQIGSRLLLHSANQQLHSYSAMGKKGKAAAQKTIVAKKDDAASKEDITIVII